MDYGYARCSTSEDRQDIQRQTRELQAVGVDAANIYYEYEHGTAIVKPELDKLLDRMQEGDTIKVTEVSRLSRSTQQLCKLIDLVQQKHICLDIIGSITIDCRSGELDPMTKAFLQMSGVFAELERNMISARVKSGMRNARSKGAKIGRPVVTVDQIPDSFYKVYPRIKAKTLTKMEAHKITGLSRVSIDKYISMVESEGQG